MRLVTPVQENKELVTPVQENQCVRPEASAGRGPVREARSLCVGQPVCETLGGISARKSRSVAGKSEVSSSQKTGKLCAEKSVCETRNLCEGELEFEARNGVENRSTQIATLNWR